MEERRVVTVTILFYFLAGSCCLLIGSSLPQLVDFYGLPIEKVVLLGSALALGRVVSVNLVPSLLKKVGPLRILMAGCAAFFCFILSVPVFRNYAVQMVMSFVGGIGLACQDISGPLLFASASKEDYSRNMTWGEAAFGLGNFFTPFLIGIMLRTERPFYTGYYLMALIPLVVVGLASQLRMTRNVESEEEPVKPIRTADLRMALLALVVLMALYSSLFNSLCTYTTTLGESIGMNEADASLLLTLFNGGGVVGALIFASLIRKRKEIDIIIGNLTACVILLTVALLMNSRVLYYPLFALMGLFVTVLFGIIITTATRINYQNMGKVAGVMSLSSGISDILTPFLTGWIIRVSGIRGVFIYILLAMLASIGTSLILRNNIRKGEIS